MLKIVSNEEMEIALKDPKIKGMMSIESNKYKQLDYDQKKSCALLALWRTLQNHDDSFGQKFTTSLYRFLHYELCREVSNQSRYKDINFTSLNDDFKEKGYSEGIQSDINDSLEVIKKTDINSYKAIYGYYIENKNLNELAKTNKWSYLKTKLYLDLGQKQMKETFSN